MKHKMFLFAVLLISTYSLFGQKPMEEDPYLLWQTTVGYSGFVIHPNGNIIANRNCEFFEIDGNTGQLLRAFPVHYGFSEILSISQSADGKYFAAIYAGGGDSVIIFITDYQTGEVYRKVKNMGDNIRFMQDSKRILITTFDRGHPNASLSVYNLEDESFHNFGAGFSSEGFAELGMSDDGRYFATGGRKKEQDGLEEKTYVYLRLWDAVTLKPIKELAKIEGNNEVRSIKFSLDGKYVGIQVGYYNLYIYNLNDLKLFKFYDYNFIEFGVAAFCFLGNDFVVTSSNKPIKLTFINVNGDIKLKTINSGKGGPFPVLEKNHINNTLIDATGQLWAFDLNKILTTVEDLPVTSSVKANYIKDTLVITGLNSISGLINITISDISGRVIRKLDSPATNSEIRIPIKLNNGTYLIHLQYGNQEYTSKFLVTE